MKETRYYEDFSKDFSKSRNQDYKLDDNYKIINDSFFFKFLSFIVYTLAIIISYFYCKFGLHMKIVGKKKLKEAKNCGYFLFGNHTQPVGDVFIPAHCALPKRIYTIASQANYGIPVIGKLLPYLGALPTGNDYKSIKSLNTAIVKRIEQKKCVVIFPEAHVWEYCTQIRPFSSASFKFPVKTDSLSFSFTTTYTKSKLFKKPKMTIFIDGPFKGKGATARDKATDLQEKITNSMQTMSLKSTYSYIEYVPLEKTKTE